MTRRAICQFFGRADLSLRSKPFPDFRLISGSFPIHVENLIERPQRLFGIAVAAQAPLHQQGRRLKHQRHLIDGAVTRGTADTLVDVNAVIEIHEIGEAVNLYPLD